MKPIIKASNSPEVTELEKNNRQLARKAAEEGIVLLKNNGVLPLKNETISLFGAGARKTIRGGTGSGDMHERYSVSIEEGLENKGYTIDTKDWIDRYDAHYDEVYRNWKDVVEEQVKGITDFMAALAVKKQYEFEYPVGIEITEEDLEKASSTIAIYVISRQAGEAYDRKLEKGDYYLDDLEVHNLKTISAHYEEVIVVINSGNSVDIKSIDDLAISGLIFSSQAGEEGGNALAELLSGDVSPSGKLTNTWAKEYTDYPSAGIFSTEGDPLQQNYEEGIYVGYRYFDSFDVEPRFPFGYGLSYTEFEITHKNTEVTDHRIKQTISVKNVGDFSGKEVVQAYATVPYTEKGSEYQRLVAFEKTNLLKPGQSQTIELTYPVKRLTQYNQEKSSYFLYAGQYLLRVGNSSKHTHVTDQLQLEETILVEKCTTLSTPEREFDELKAPERTTEKYEALNRGFDLDIKEKVHQYEALPICEDAQLYDFIKFLPVEDLVELVIGGDVTGQRVVTLLGASGSTSSALYKKYGIPNIILSDGPAGLNITPELVVLPSGEVKSTSIYEQYYFGIFKKMMKERVGKKEEGTPKYQYATAWPASILLAQTWNTELLSQVGYGTGLEMEKYGATIWLSPGMNIQRNPLGGRGFEYYSEDPVLSGKMAAAITKGVQQNRGKGVSLKHFSANNSEMHRHKSSSNVTERALREIYLKGFEIALEETSPLTIMASYNKINGVYNTNNHDLLVKVLRNEWHYKGVVISDWEAIDEQKADLLKAHAAQCDLAMPGTKAQAERLIKAIQNNEVDLEDIQRSAARVLNLIRKNTVIPFEL